MPAIEGAGAAGARGPGRLRTGSSGVVRVRRTGTQSESAITNVLESSPWAAFFEILAPDGIQGDVVQVADPARRDCRHLQVPRGVSPEARFMIRVPGQATSVHPPSDANRWRCLPAWYSSRRSQSTRRTTVRSCRRLRRITCLLLVAFIGAGLWTRFVLPARQAALQEEIRRGRRAFSQAITENPRNADAYQRSSAPTPGRFAGCLADLDRAIELDPANATPGFPVALQRRMRYRQRVDRHRTAVQLGGQRPPSTIGPAPRRGDYRGAVEDYSRPRSDPAQQACNNRGLAGETRRS
jgi:hypothetical protein